MPKKENKKNERNLNSASLWKLVGRYKIVIAVLIFFTVFANGLSIVIPRIIARAIDDYTSNSFIFSDFIIEFSLIAFFIFVFTYLQSIIQIYASEKVARDMREDIIAKISNQSYSYIETITPAKLLTNLTSDVDSVKTFISMAVTAIVSSVFLIGGVSILLIIIDWKLALAVLSVMPIIGLVFFLVFREVRKLFTKVQEAIDWLNKVIGDNISGSTLVRILNSQKYEDKKFLSANTQARDVSFEILRLFSRLMPTITFFTNIAVLIIIVLGGRFIIQGELSLGNFTAFNSYLAILIFPIIILGFVSNIIAQAQVSYERIMQVLKAPAKNKIGKFKADLKGNIEVKNLKLTLGGKIILQDISFEVKSGSKVAIIGPTAAGKTQLLYLLMGLLLPSSGKILFDKKNIQEYNKENFHKQVGFVFQDNAIFNLSLRENIAFSNIVKDEDIKKAIETAELGQFIEGLPQKLDTLVSERGTSLSGGQKQRIMLARALALNPKILFLDDFTARVDNQTERKILNNISKNYPQLTLISVTQKISSVKDYEQIILLMEGEILNKGIHKELMQTSPEYVQIYRSQKSTNQYELNNDK